MPRSLMTHRAPAKPPVVGTATESGPSSAAERYFNRELSWLAFNERVLAEACNREYPLLERLRFLSISGSNLDEFLTIRVAGLVGQMQRGIDNRSIDGKSPAQQLTEIRRKVEELGDIQQSTLDELRGLLAEQGIRIADIDELGKDALRGLRRYFVDELSRVLTPQAIDPAHPFPFISNLGLALLFKLRRKADNASLIEMVLVPSGIPRFVRLPDQPDLFVPVEAVIARFAYILFPGFTIRGSGVFRVLRDSDIEFEEEAEDLVRFFRSAIQRRRRGRVILLELGEGFDPDAEALLREELALSEALVTRSAGMLAIGGLGAIVDALDRPDLSFEPFTPRYPERILEHDGDVFAAIRAKDIVIQHPYESFEVVVDFLRRAAADPAVVSIKQTLYRAGNQSPVINALIAAAEAGKSVTAVVELKARFDEEQNLHWAAQLERAGIQVIYGFIDWKTHAKISMVVRREEEGFRTYCHFGTGNYHPVTTRIYTDLSYFTADPALGRDAAKLFNFVTGYVEPSRMEAIAISPLNLRERLFELIDREIEHAREGKPAMIWAKLNAMTERQVIDRLYEASQAGVVIDLVVRGNCCLRPGVPGLSENITVKSIIGRFLEHSRIWAFGNGHRLPSARAKVFITSADAMSRNLDRRVEVLVPLRNKTVHDQVLRQVLLANLLDTEQSWRLQADGSYVRMATDDEGRRFNVHTYFMKNPSLSGRGTALDSESVPTLTLRGGKRR
ncbi:RNA degradosome polyphosphate kinase [Croceicoccus sp. BE223]|uniref:RNA degradosome polyphosphate kinase n=1 Tax=Croceicoccus sp. BE223 TaxID=2817716 RepID=UPI0028600467|nr:RNA degradosome polyphosphate kinase [Croceicoccus sp. BE223]MDR7101926.1 polyphosphate kinase [Croceicoccus sp. BE223]